MKKSVFQKTNSCEIDYIKIKEDEKYYWSPVNQWKKEDKEIYIEEIIYSGIAVYVFPKLYFITQEGITIEGIFKEFSMVDEEQLNSLIKKLIKNRVLVNTILPLKDVFNPLNKMYDNKYGDEIYYDAKAYESYKKQQLNRVLPYDRKGSIKLKSQEEYSEAISNRRTYREFNENREISFAKFSKLMTVFKQRRKNNEIYYYYASGGGLYPIDIYVYIKENRVEKIDAGLYYYNPKDNSLTLVNNKEKITKYSYGYGNKSIFEASAFSIYFIYNADATMPKYGAMGYIYACIDAGIMVSTLTQVSETQNIGLCSIGTMDFEGIRSMFRLNKNQIFVHAIEIGLKTGEDIKEENKSRSIDLIEPTDNRKYYPLASPQKRMYFLNKFEGESTNYNNLTVIELEGEIDINKVEGIFKKLVARHEAFRTGFEIVEEEPMQKIYDEIDFKMEYSEAKEEETGEIIKAFSRPFNLSKAPLLRVGLIRISDNKHILMVDMHHIISDGVSIAILIGEFARIYMGEKLPELRIQYKDYAIWQREGLESEEIKKQEKYWLERFSGDIPVLNMPIDYKRPAVQNFQGNSIDFNISKELKEKIHKLAKENETTLYMVLLTAYNILLSKYTGGEDIVIGSPIAGRPNADLKNVVGMFVNVLALRNNPEGDKTIEEFLDKVKENCLRAYDNQNYQYEELIERLNIPRDPSRNSLFDVVFVLQNMDIKEVDLKHAKAIISSKYRQKTSKFDLTLLATETNEGIHINIEYATSLFKEATIKRLGRYFIDIVEEMVENPNKKLNEVDILKDEEKKVILHNFNDTAVKYDEDKTIVELFEEQVERTSEKIAIETEGKGLTYNELNQRTNIIGRLLRSKGVKPDNIVGIMLDRSVDMITAIIGVLKSGGAYLPIDPEYPIKRIKYIIEDSDIDILITKRDLIKQSNLTKEIISIEDISIKDKDTSNLKIINKATDLAYVIYTSGSTGNPKGVMIEHKSLINTINWMQRKYPLENKDIILQNTTFTFDVSVWELLWWSIYGGSVYLLEPNQEKEPNKILEVIQKKKITIMHFVPSMLSAFLKYVEQVNMNNKEIKLRQVFTSGEALQINHVEEFYRYFYNVKLSNLYGPTEATIYSSYYDCENKEYLKPIPIGKPIDNIKLFILDKNRNLQPIGVVGELYIAGDGLGRGYINKPELTAEKFVENPFKKGERMYKTGDLARWLPDGNIEYLGRIDHQVKIRGYRIELGEIENIITKQKGVKGVVVLSRKDKIEMDYLCAYIEKEAYITIESIKGEIRKELPEYMIPSVFIEVNEIPLTSNGKIDRKSLLKIEAKITKDKKYEGPSNETEARLVKLWEDLLDIEKIGVCDNFFDLGGHSLRATILSGRIQRELDVEITVRDIFNYPNIRELSKYIKESTHRKYEKLKPLKKNESYPVSSAQRRIYAIQMIDKENTIYNMPLALELTGKVDRERIEKAIEKLVVKHEALRTSFHLDGEEIVQKIEEKVKVELDYARAEEKEAIDKIIRDWIKPFRLEKAPLIRGGIIEAKNSYILMLDMHHIISDGTTIGILAEDFVKVYEGIKLDREVVQYKEYAVWEKKQKENGVWDKQKEYWKKEYEGEIPVLELPLDGRRSGIGDDAGSRISFEIEEETTKGLKERMSDIDGTLYMGLMAAISILMSKYSGLEDIIIGMPIAGRRHPQMEKVAGMFVNTLAIRTYPESHKPIAQYLEETKQKLLMAYENQEYPYEELVQEVGVKRDLSRNPLFDVMLALQNMNSKEVNLKDVKIKHYKTESDISKFDIALSVTEDKGKLLCEIEYKDKLFKKDTIEAIAKHYKKILQEIIEKKEGRINDIQLLEEVEKEKLLFKFNNTKVEYDKGKTIQELFEEQAARIPDNIAVVYDGKQLTYRQLNERANKLARELSERGVGPETIVGIMVERSLEMVVGIIAILKAGGAYLPIDSTYPKERIKYMLDDSNASILLSKSKLIDRLKEFKGKIIDLEDDNVYKKDCKSLDIVNKSENLAYIIYTSGSTGRPKGVMVEHRNVIRLVNNTNYIKFNKNDKILQTGSISFDASTFEIWGALLNGLELHLVDEEVILDADKLGRIIQLKKITILWLTSPLFTELGNCNYKIFKPLRYLLVGGDVINPSTINKVKDSCQGIRVVHVYGPTENTTFSTYFLINKKYVESIPIGKPISNSKVYIVDKDINLQPLRIPGEIYVSGDGLSRGYLNRSELTKEKFVENPFVNGERMYKTGDIARWLPDGNIEFLGRIDHQVKIRGYRVELGEIEDALLKHKNMKEVVVVARKDDNGNKYLCGYLVADKQMTVSQLREYLKKHLPEYMIPPYMIQLDKMPLTPNGKINRKALLNPDESTNIRVEYRAPRNEIEETLVNIWRKVLSTNNEIGINDDFFEIGGDSIKAIQISSRLKKYNLKLEVQKIFEYPTIEQLSYYVKDISESGEQGSVEGSAKLTPIQKWFFKQSITDMHHWNQSVMLYREDGFKLEIIEAAFEELVKHHDALRMVYTVKEEGISQINRGLEGKLIDIEVHDIKQEYKEVIEKKSEKIQSSIDLGRGPLVKLGLFKTKKGDYLLIAIHHLVIDGVSWRIIFEDFTSTYKQIENGQAIELPLKTASFKEWSLGLREYSKSKELLKEIEYWCSIESQNILPLPKDKKAKYNKLKDSENISFKLSEGETQNLLERVNRAYNTEINDILLAALGLTVNEWAGINKILINLEGHGREKILESIDITRTIGWFTSQYPVVIDIDASKDISYTIKNTKETLRKVPNKGIGHGILKYITPKEYTKEINFKLKPEISFNYLGQFDTDINNDLFDISNLPEGNPISINSERQYTLDISGILAKNVLTISLNYNKYEYKNESVLEFVKKYKLNLQKIIEHCINKKEMERTPSDFDDSDLNELEDIFDYLESI